MKRLPRKMAEREKIIFLLSSGIFLLVAAFLFADDLREDFTKTGIVPFWKRLLAWICLGLGALSFGGVVGHFLRWWM